MAETLKEYKLYYEDIPENSDGEKFLIWIVDQQHMLQEQWDQF